jgi:putative ABC transport system permease protein
VNLLATTSVALAALLRNKMRSSLTMLGIVIGVAAVVTMQSMGQGATAYVGEAISGLGSNMLIAMPGASSKGFGRMTLGVPLFTTADVDAIRRDAHDVDHIAVVNSRTVRVVVGPNNRTVNTGGVSPDYYVIRDWGVSEGRLPSQEDERQGSLVCVVGRTVKDELFGGQDPIGQEMRVHDMPCRVIGVMEAKGASAFGIDQDDIVLMPYSTFSRRIIGNERIVTIMASAVSKDQLDSAKEEITTILRRRRHIREGDEDDFGVRDPREIQDLLQSVTGMLTTLLAGVAAVSLLVGGIGIMNIMLVSVTERTREIGVRLAVGARSADILTQFLVEASVLSCLGGIVGIGFGVGAAYGVAKAIHIPFVLPLATAPLAFGVSLVIGVIFGVIPARKAAHLNPLEALRFE